ncbi:MAG: SIMPL domain-containing protein [Chloroflexi bacterium]|nr:SIMPL domain-containing protein [Chloroflexota bacterium]
MLRMNRKTMLAATLISAALVLTAGCAAIPAAEAAGGTVSPSTAVSQQGTAGGRGITVVGVGSASGAPDIANINVGIETQAPNVQQAVADNRTQMNKLLEVLKELGIPDKDISTSNYSVYTERQQSPTPAENGQNAGVLIYRVNNQVLVTVRDVAKLGDVLDKVVDAGANNIYGVNFSVGDTSKLEVDARGKAMQDARARAESLAKLAGVTLGEVVSVSEVIGGPLPYARAAADMAQGGGATPIQPGSLEVNMSVQVTYAIQ